MDEPVLIQGGMGVGISNWRLARAVSQSGQLGVVSGSLISRVVASRLMDGDLEGHVRRALEAFPLQEQARKVVQRFYMPGGKAPGQPYKPVPAYTARPTKFLDQLTAIANFVEVFLAREGHSGRVGINLLEKIQMPTLASLYGAMLAGVDYVLMGAGIPTQVAGALDKLSAHEPTSYRLDVKNAAPEDDVRMHFDPERVFPGITALLGKLKRPKFLPIISSVVLAQALLKRSEGEIHGFVVEGPTAGGHNAPPRGPLTLNERGEPIYGEKDAVDLAKMKHLGRPFWLAGGYGRPAQVKEALDAGAAGVQVGTAFALCEESGMEPGLRQRVLQGVLERKADIFTDPVASPTGFPFRVARVEGTASELEVYQARPRICDLGFLRVMVRTEDGSMAYRCPAEPVDEYVKKGGKEEDTVGRTCLCNNLMSTTGYPQIRAEGYVEPPIVTSGEDLVGLGQFVPAGKSSYTAADVIRRLLGPGLQRGDVEG